MLKIFDIGYILHQFSPKKVKKIADFLAWKTLYKGRDYSDEKVYSCWQAISHSLNEEKLFLNLIHKASNYTTKITTGEGGFVNNNFIEAILYCEKEKIDKIRGNLFSNEKEKQLLEKWENEWRKIKKCDKRRFPYLQENKMKFSLMQFESLLNYFSLRALTVRVEHEDMNKHQSKISEEEIDYLFKLINLDPSGNNSLNRAVFYQKATDQHIKDIKTLHPSGAIVNIEKVRKLIENRRELFSYVGNFLIGVVAAQILLILKKRKRLTIKQIILLLYLVLAEIKTFIFS